MTKQLTVMVSIYESGDWIENRLDNLTKILNLSDTEIWCINANSPDSRDDIIPQKFPVKYIKLPERIGVYAAWNHIIKESRGTYLTNANTDDIVAPNCYQSLISAIENTKAGFAYPSWYTTAAPNLKWEEIHSHHPTKIDDGGRPGHYRGDLERGGVGHFPLWKRSLHDKLGLFDERFRALGDADWWARCFFKEQTGFVWVDAFLACYLWRSGENLWHKSINNHEWSLYHSNVQQYQL